MNGMPCMPMRREPHPERSAGRRAPATCPGESAWGGPRRQGSVGSDWPIVLPLIPLLALVTLGVVVLLLAAGLSSVGWLGLAILLVGGGLAVAGSVRRRRTRRRPGSLSPDQWLRLRFANGEIGRQEYQDALVTGLQDRYVRGDIDLDEFDARLTRLLAEPRARSSHVPR